MESIAEIYASEKRIAAFGDTQWVLEADKQLVFTAALVVGEIVIEGLLLKAKARQEYPDEQVTFWLEHPIPRSRERALDRVDWRPFHSHNNKARGPSDLQLVEVSGSHHHSFELNWMSDEERLKSSNLPIATPIEPDPSNFEELIVLVSELYRIVNLEELQSPPWEKALL